MFLDTNKKFLIGLKIFLTICLFFVWYGQADAAVLSRAPNSLGLIGYWPMNEGTGAQAGDMSGNGNTGTLTEMDSATDWVAGRLGKALDFDNSNDRVVISNESNFDFSSAQSATFSAWIKPTNLVNSKDEFIVAKGNPASSRQYALRLRSGGTGFGKLQFFYMDDVAGAHIFADDASNSVANNTWYHIAFTYTFGTSATAKLYINGVQVSSSWTTGTGNGTPVNTSNQLSIGAETTVDADEMFGGKIDEVRVYNRALSATEVANLYKAGQVKVNKAGLTEVKINTSPTTKLTSGLVGYWTFDGKDTSWTSATAATTLDKSGNGNTGTLTNMSRTSSPVIGKLGQGFQFDGVDDYVDAGDPYNFGTGNFSVSSWVYATNLTNFKPVIAFYNIAGSLGWAIEDIGGLDWIDFVTSSNQRARSTAMTRNTWHHVVAIRNGSIISIYVDGVKGSDATASDDVDNIPSSKLSFGGWANAWSGKIDDVRIYNRALSANEIKQLYNMGI